MKKNSSKRGFATWQVLVVLVVVIAVIISGWLVWKNQDTPTKTDTKSDSTAVKAKVSTNKKVEESKDYCVTNEKLCFTYPSDWIVSATEDASPQTDKITNLPMDRVKVSTDSGENILELVDGYGGLGGVCDTAAADQKTQVIEVVKTGITMSVKSDNTFQMPDLYAVKVVAHGQDGFTANVYLTNLRAYTSPGANIDEEGLCFSAFFTGRTIRLVDNSGVATADGAAMRFVGTSKAVPTRAEAETLLGSADFVKAFAILKSAHY